VRIGLSRDSRARYFLRNQLEIDKLLRILVELREEEAAQTVRRRVASA